MATLFNTKISATYEGLLKTIDNAAITATLRELTDGSGNQSGLYLNTAGDFKVSSVLEWGSLKDTGTGVTITQFVTAANGIENFNNDTTLPTSAAVKLYVDTKFSITDTLTEVLGFGNTTSGKDIAVSAGDDITFTDSSRILMGVSSDLQIYHDGSNSYVRDTGTGRLWLDSNGEGVSIISDGSGATPMAHFYKDAAVELYYNNVKKFETTSLGSTVTGDLLVTGSITGAGGSFLPLAGGTMTGNTIHGDNVKSQYGIAPDLEIYHDGNNSFINEIGTGFLFVTSGEQIRLGNSITGEKFARFFNNAQVELFYNNDLKLETTNTGIKWYGDALNGTNGNLIMGGGQVKFGDSGRLFMGDSNDLQIYHDGSNSFIKDTGTGSLILTGENDIALKSNTNERYLVANKDSSVDLFYDNVLRLETVTDGAKVTGNLEVTGTITGAGGSFLPLAGGIMTGNTVHEDNVKSRYGNNGDLEIYHDGSNSYIADGGTGGLFIKGSAFVSTQSANGENMIKAIADGAVELYFNNSSKFRTTSTGISVTGAGNFTGNVTVPDNANLIAGSNSDFAIIHDTNDTRLKNNTGGLYIDQIAVTKSIFFRVSNANAVDTTALTINREGDLITGADVTIAGNLTVNGTTTTVNSQTLSVEDPLISLATANAANSLDIGFYGKYNDGTTRYLGLFNDSSDSNKFRLFKGTTVEPTTTVNIAGAGYLAADLVVAGLEATTATIGSSTQGSTLTVSSAEGSRNTRFLSAGNGGFVEYASANDGIYGYIGSGSQLLTPVVNNNDFILRSESEFVVSIGATEKFRINATGNASFSKNVDLTGGRLSITSDGANAATLTESSAGIFTIASVDDLILDSGSDLTLDAAGNDIRFKVSNVEFGKIKNDSGSLAIYSSIQDRNIRFLGNDGGSTITALTLDMSESGNATFLGDVVINGGDLNVGNASSTNSIINLLGTGNTFIEKDTGTDLYIANNVSDKDIKFRVRDNGVNITALNLDGSEGGNATFVGDVYTKNLKLGNGSTDSSIQLDGDFGGGDLSIQNLGNDKDIYFKGNDNGVGITALALDMSEGGNATFAGKILAGVGATSAATINAFSTTVASNLFSALRVIDNTAASSFWDIGATGGSSTELRFCHNGNTTPKISFTHLGGATFAGDVGIASSVNALRIGGNGVLGVLNGLTRLSGTGGSSGGIIFTPNNDNTETMRIDFEGNVGIGTSTPLAKMHIKSAFAGSFTYDTSADDLIVESNANGGMTIATAAASTGRIIFASPDDPTGAEISYNASGSLMKIGTTGANGILALQSGNGAEAMRITSAGDVSIQTEGKGLVLKSPNGTEYKITVANDGTITSTAV